jgi:hypothetical protein
MTTEAPPIAAKNNSQLGCMWASNLIKKVFGIRGAKIEPVFDTLKFAGFWHSRIRHSELDHLYT